MKVSRTALKYIFESKSIRIFILIERVPSSSIRYLLTSIQIAYIFIFFCDSVKIMEIIMKKFQTT